KIRDATSYAHNRRGVVAPACGAAATTPRAMPPQLLPAPSPPGRSSHATRPLPRTMPRTPHTPSGAAGRGSRRHRTGRCAARPGTARRSSPRSCRRLLVNLAHPVVEVVQVDAQLFRNPLHHALRPDRAPRVACLVQRDAHPCQRVHHGRVLVPSSHRPSSPHAIRLRITPSPPRVCVTRCPAIRPTTG